VGAVLFTRDDAESLQDWTALDKIGRSSLLWIDLESSEVDDDELDALSDRLGLTRTTIERLGNGDRSPFFEDAGEYLHVSAYAPIADERARLAKVECLVSERWVVTVHEQRVPVIERFKDLAEGSGETGLLNGLGFLADLLEWVFASYLEAFEKVEVELETVDAEAMAGSADEETHLGKLVTLRQDIGNLRRALVAHREIVLALTRPELEAISDSTSAARFEGLRARLENTVQAARDGRESVAGSFDLLITRTGQRTNEIMKVLTLASVLLLPGALIAGIMGMNFKLGVFQDNTYFWITIGLMVAIILATLALARVRRWI
jgi:magnesium/cobalt transport protein CorA